MGKKKGKQVDQDKKAALQAKKEAKAEKAARKRLQKKESKGAEASRGADATKDDSEELDSLLQQYQQQDQNVTTTYVETLEDFPPARSNASFTLYEDTKKKNAEVYMFGGEYYDGVENIVLDHLLKFDVSKQEWKRIVTAPTSSPPTRCAHSCVYYNHSLFIFGGELATADEYHHYKDVWRYDIKSQTWHEIRPSKVGGTIPTARSGHAAVVWKHFMVVFGGFYEALRDTPRWFNDVTVLNLQTLQWMDIPHSKLTARPEPRSACNAAVIGDDVIVHGGFSKLSRSSVSRHSSGDTAEDPSSTSSPETKVHTDAWLLHLKPLLQGKPPTWERLTSSMQRSQLLAACRTSSPNGRSGTAAVSYKNRLLVYGGVVDKEHHHHKVESVFYNDLFAFDLERRKWFPVHVKKSSGGSQSRRRRRRKNEDKELDDNPNNNGDDPEINDDSSDLEEEEEEIDENESENRGWDLDKLRSNMFAFVDGDGNLIYEKIEEEPETRSKGQLSDEEEEKEDVKEDDDRQDEQEQEEAASEHDEEKEESKEQEISSTKAAPKVGSTKQDSSGIHTIVSSSVMALNPETKIPEPVVRSEPLPRIKCSLVVSGSTLLLYGGLLEVGDREVTLDDLWSLDLRKRERWECIWAGTMHKQVWRGAVHDDDDSYYSTDKASADNEEDDMSNDYFDEEVKDSEMDKKAGKGDKLPGLREEIAEMNEKYGLGDKDRTPQPGEVLADFYARTSAYWNEQASNVEVAELDSNNPLSSKELKREGFRLARKRFEELEPVMRRLGELDVVSSVHEDRKSGNR